LTKPLPLRVGDRGLLRDPSQRRILGALILAVEPPALTRRGSAQARSDDLAALAEAPRRLGTALRLHDTGFAHATDLRAEGLLPDRAPIQDGWYADEAAWASLVVRAGEELADWAREHPAAAGIPADALRGRLGLPSPELLAALLKPAGLEVSDGLVHRPGEADTLPPAIADVVRAIEADLAGAPFQAPSADRLAELGAGHRELAAAVRAGRLIQLAAGVVLRADAIEQAEQVLAGLPTPFSVSEARAALATSRRVAVPLLELLDRRGATTRLADGTRVTRRATPGDPG
jgi:selenocysteine-specific elongation factor